MPLIKEEVATKESRVENAGEDIEVVFESKTRMRNARLVCRVREAERRRCLRGQYFPEKSTHPEASTIFFSKMFDT